MKRTIVIITLLLFIILLPENTAHAQTELDESAMLSFDRGLGFHAPDTSFGLNLRFRIQNRIGVTSTAGEDFEIEEIDARIRRLRLRLDGYAINENLTYYLQLSFSRSDLGWDIDQTPDIVRDAMVYYSFSDNLYIGFGQGKLPGNRQRINSSGQLQFTDRSNVNAHFNIDRDFGVMGYYSSHISGLAYNLKTAVSTGDGRNAIASDYGLSYTSRLEILPFGRFTGNGDFSEGDLEREPTPKLSIAGGYSFNHNATRTMGQRGSLLFEARDIRSLYFDALIKYRGWAAFAEYMDRNTDFPLTVSSDAELSQVYTGYGINMQLSYVFPNNVELAGRYTLVNPEKIYYNNGLPLGVDVNPTFLSAPGTEEYTLGITRYIARHKIKAQGNIGYRKTENLAPLASQESNWIMQFQVELGI